MTSCEELADRWGLRDPPESAGPVPENVATERREPPCLPIARGQAHGSRKLVWGRAFASRPTEVLAKPPRLSALRPSLRGAK